MPSWHQILNEIRTTGSTHDVLRRRFLAELHKHTGRNTIIYYSGWLQKPNVPGTDVNDSDKNGFMTVVHGLDRSKGLDLLLHTPGGNPAATESLVDYLRQMFDTDIRAMVPQLAMSAGTMIACSARSIVMGKQSSLGPIDPQLGGVPAHGVVEEFKRAYDEIKADQAKIAIWQPIIAKYHPTLMGECEKAIQWSDEMVKDWLVSGMLADADDPSATADSIIKDLGDHALMKSHSRHLSAQRCADMGLRVEMLEDDDRLQDLVLSVHHSCVHTLTSTPACKIIENHEGVAFIQSAQTVVLKQQ
jgi:ATP-dependent protease ClpP protease subunit